MSAHAGDHEHAFIPPHDFPMDRDMGRATLGKIGMWIFLVSDALMFGGLLLAYGILRGGSSNWWDKAAGEPDFGINFTALLTFWLICSSVTMVLAYAAAVEGNRKRLCLFLFLTILGGVGFLCGQYKEYFGIEWLAHLTGIEWFAHGLTHEGLTMGESARASSFYLITSFHGCHVLTGVIYLCCVLKRALGGAYDNGNYNNIEIVGLFWHFVDLIWILVFTLVYLL